jgi:hypothetical protein
MLSFFSLFMYMQGERRIALDVFRERAGLSFGEHGMVGWTIH